MAKNLGDKIVCPKCKTKFYSMGKRKASCPKCQKDNIIPDGSEVQVKLKIRPGGYNDFKLGWTDGMASEGKAGAIYLNCEFSVLSPPHVGKKFFSLIGAGRSMTEDTRSAGAVGWWGLTHGSTATGRCDRTMPHCGSGYGSWRPSDDGSATDVCTYC